ncbi:MAG TPA: cytochrome c biogenesis protein ResB [Verrucomicrobiae bacterium]|nr:cytochrome c biogenesis protein ResB [Verrucomicrobiae bacterium]
MLDRLVNFFTSLRLTVVCLCLAIILVFVGTIAQARLGLYAVQSDFFRSFLIYWTPTGTHWRIPIFPGGWLLGLLLLMNLLAAHIKRFKFERRKIGILMIHGGLILLLVGQFVTEIFQVESQMRIEVGDTKNYSEDSRKNELAVVDVTDPKSDHVVSIPESLVAKGGDIRTPDLPFTLRVEKYFQNSFVAGPMQVQGDTIKASEGIGKRLFFNPAQMTRRMDDENEPAVHVQALSDSGPIGDWTLSTWFTRYPRFAALQQDIGGMLPGLSLTDPQSFTFKGRTYKIALRPVRYYKPYSITLLAFHHDLYPGTDIPKNFSSKIHLNNPTAGDDRDILIYMNNPLRYHGETFFQASFEEGDRGTILQVMRNPASMTPYIACLLVALGLLVQFLSHLLSFARKRAKQTKPVVARTAAAVPLMEPALAHGKRSRL